MKNVIVLGVDPGLANCGLAIVEATGTSYALLASRLLHTSPKEREPERLLHLYNNVFGLLNQFDIAICAVERVFHNQNISSSIKVGKAIGAIEVAVACHARDVIEVRPQEVKQATGLGAKASKDAVKRMMSRLLGTDFRSDHVADAAAVAVTGCLKYKSCGLDTCQNSQS